jgi:hypothetical protein
MMSDPSPQLDYAPPPPAHQRRSFRRWIIYAVLALVVFSGWFWVPRIVWRVEMRYYYGHSLGHTAPQSLVAVEPDPAKAAALIAQGTHLPDISGNAVYVADSLAGMHWGVGHCVFLHGRRTPAGEQRLILVELMKVNSVPQLYARAIHLDLFSNPITTSANFHTLPPGPSHPLPDVPRLYAGQPDPTDDSHFTIKYEYSDRSGILDGWLKDDDSIVIEPRNEEPAFVP